LICIGDGGFNLKGNLFQHSVSIFPAMVASY
jgi:hypothetical protein